MKTELQICLLQTLYAVNLVTLQVHPLGTTSFDEWIKKTKTLFMNYFTKLKLILFIKGFQDNFFNTLNLRHFVVLFLLPFTESTYRSCIFSL